MFPYIIFIAIIVQLVLPGSSVEDSFILLSEYELPEDAVKAQRRQLVPKDLKLVSTGEKRNGRPWEQPIVTSPWDHLNHIDIWQTLLSREASSEQKRRRKGIRYNVEQQSGGVCRTTSSCSSFDKSYSQCRMTWGCTWKEFCRLGRCGVPTCIARDKQQCESIADKESCTDFPDCQWQYSKAALLL